MNISCSNKFVKYAIWSDNEGHITPEKYTHNIAFPDLVWANANKAVYSCKKSAVLNCRVEAPQRWGKPI
jgi:hypothetical protein